MMNAKKQIIFSIAVLQVFITVSIVKAFYAVKVQLAACTWSSDTRWIITAEQELTVRMLEKTTGKKKEQKVSRVELCLSQGRLLLNNTPCATQVISITSPNNKLQLEDKVYLGSLLIYCNAVSEVMLINSVPLEDYVHAVLEKETWPGWPEEVNKAHAISIRSYVIAKIRESQAQRKPYHVKNTNIHQVYKGMAQNTQLRKAIDETQGLVLAYNKKPILAMFDVCCGGIIPAKIKGVNFEHSPYLKRMYACTFCASAKAYTWGAEYILEQFATLLKEKNIDIGRLRDIKITKKDAAGIVQEVVIRGTKGKHVLTGKKMYSLCKNIKSFCFTASKKGRTISFKGRGYGHHLGLCQWGARAMVKEGWSYRDILKFYYPGTCFMKLQV